MLILLGGPEDLHILDTWPTRLESLRGAGRLTKVPLAGIFALLVELPAMWHHNPVLLSN